VETGELNSYTQKKKKINGEVMALKYRPIKYRPIIVDQVREGRLSRHQFSNAVQFTGFKKCSNRYMVMTKN
jgi:hypothetical protein